jgi:hypothetical protein
MRLELATKFANMIIKRQKLPLVPHVTWWKYATMSMFVMHFVSFREKVPTIVDHWEHEYDVCSDYITFASFTSDN